MGESRAEQVAVEMAVGVAGPAVVMRCFGSGKLGVIGLGNTPSSDARADPETARNRERKYYRIVYRADR